MRTVRVTLLAIAALLAAPSGATDLLSAMRLADTIVSGARRLAIIETTHGEQRIIAEGDSVGGCTVKQIRADGVDLECRGRLKSLGFHGRARIASEGSRVFLAGSTA
ncbi:MAG TPA: hypothetical protein VJ764_04615 [Steroidobacteraceae bacterium]|nr:hypothetical protein [Steroidobacteraceae bacterium]